MTKFSLLFLFLIWLIPHLRATKLEDAPQEVKNIYIFGKIWGFLKYYHPTVKSGNYNWDNEFQKQFDNVRSATNTDQFNQIISEWISSLGKVKGCKTKAKKKNYFDKNFELAWIDDTTIIRSDVRSVLKNIYDHRGKKQFYVEYGRSYQAVPINESLNDAFDYQSTSHRFNAMFMFWNFVEYFYPYKYLMDNSWDNSLLESIPRLLESDTPIAFHSAMLQLSSNIDDSHGLYHNTIVRDLFGEKFIAGIFSIIEDQVVITGYYNDSLAQIDDIKRGDIVTHIDGISVDDIIEKRSEFIPYSNDTWKSRPYSVFNGATEEVVVTVIRSGEKLNKTYHRYHFDDLKFLPHKIDAEVCHKRIENRVICDVLGNKIGYIRLHSIDKNEVDSLMNKIKSTKGLILDLRGHNIDNFIDKLLPYFQSEKTAFAQVTRPDLSCPGRFIYQEPETCGGKSKSFVYSNKVVVLTNSGTLSSSEFLCMALQTAPNVTIIGSQTAGADGNISKFDFVEKTLIKLSGKGVYYPDGRATQRIGIKPDIEVESTVDSITKEQDLQLETAIEFLLK